MDLKRLRGLSLRTNLLQFQESSPVDDDLTFLWSSLLCFSVRCWICFLIPQSSATFHSTIRNRQSGRERQRTEASWKRGDHNRSLQEHFPLERERVFTIKHICVFSSQPECHPSLSTSVQTQTNKHKNKHKACNFWVCISHQTALLRNTSSHTHTRTELSFSRAPFIPSSPKTSRIICNIFFIIPLFLCDFSSESDNFTVAWHQDLPFFPSLFWTVA